MAGPTRPAVVARRPARSGSDLLSSEGEALDAGRHGDHVGAAALLAQQRLLAEIIALLQDAHFFFFQFACCRRGGANKKCALAPRWQQRLKRESTPLCMASVRMFGARRRIDPHERIVAHFLFPRTPDVRSNRPGSAAFMLTGRRFPVSRNARFTSAFASGFAAPRRTCEHSGASNNARRVLHNPGGVGGVGGITHRRSVRERAGVVSRRAGSMRIDKKLAARRKRPLAARPSGRPSRLIRSRLARSGADVSLFSRLAAPSSDRREQKSAARLPAGIDITRWPV